MNNTRSFPDVTRDVEGDDALRETPLWLSSSKQTALGLLLTVLIPSLQMRHINTLPLSLPSVVITSDALPLSLLLYGAISSLSSLHSIRLDPSS